MNSEKKIMNEQIDKFSTTLEISCTNLILIYKFEFQILNKLHSTWSETVKQIMTIFL